jgi:hypothetical protein
MPEFSSATATQSVALGVCRVGAKQRHAITQGFTTCKTGILFQFYLRDEKRFVTFPPATHAVCRPPALARQINTSAAAALRTRAMLPEIGKVQGMGPFL